MSDDPKNAELEEIRKLQSLTPLFRKGWAKLHPMPEKDRALIEQAFSKATHGQKAQTADAKKVKSPKAITPRKAGVKPKKSQTKNQGPSHSH